MRRLTLWQSVSTRRKPIFANNSISFKVASDLLGWEGKIVLDYAVYATPSMYIVDKNMNIVAKPITGEQLFNVVESLIKF